MTVTAHPDDPWPPGVPPASPFPVPGVPGAPGAPGAGDDLRAVVYERLLRRRTVMLDRPLDGEAAGLVAAQLTMLDTESPGPMTLVVNSPGGPLDAVAAVVDTIELVAGPVDTTCLGQAVGTAAVVLAAGTGRRRIGAGAQVRLRLPDVELDGPADRLGAEVAHLARLRDALVDRLASRTGQERRLVARDLAAGRALTAPEAVAYGLVDEVIEPGAR